MTESADERDRHTVFVGGKPFYNYVTAVVMQFATSGIDTVIIRSRGKFIHRAVDVAEVVKSRFLKGQVDVNSIEIGSEEFKNREGKLVRVSTIDITLGKTGSGPVQSSVSDAISSTKEEPTEDIPTPEEVPAEVTEELPEEEKKEEEIKEEIPVEVTEELPEEPKEEIPEEVPEEPKEEVSTLVTEETPEEAEKAEESEEAPKEKPVEETQEEPKEEFEASTEE